MKEIAGAAVAVGVLYLLGAFMNALDKVSNYVLFGGLSVLALGGLGLIDYFNWSDPHWPMGLVLTNILVPVGVVYTWTLPGLR